MFDKNIMDKLHKMQQNAEEAKRKLSQLKVSAEAGSNLIFIEMNGNRELTDLTINAPLDQLDKNDLEDLLAVALKRVLEKANELNEKEMANTAKNFIPGL